MYQYYLLLSLTFTFLLLSCAENKFEGTYSSNDGPYFKFTKNQKFEFGVPNDKNPLKGTFTKKDNNIYLFANSIILGSYATTTFDCYVNNDTLTIEVFHLTHPKFEILINKPENFAKTVKDTLVKEMKLNSPEAEEELFLYYKLVFDKFIKRNGG